MKIKTIEAVNAYKAIKEMKLNSLSEDTLISVWKNQKALRHVSEEYDKDVEDAKKSLEDDKHAEMVKRLQAAMEREKLVKEGKHEMTPEEKQDVQEINKWFAEYQTRGKKFFDDAAEKEVEIEITKLPENEIVKALKENGKTFEAVESLVWMME